MHGEIASGNRPPGRPLLLFEELSKRDFRAMNIDVAIVWGGCTRPYLLETAATRKPPERTGEGENEVRH